jgi:hypothetical protein
VLPYEINLCQPKELKNPAVLLPMLRWSQRHQQKVPCPGGIIGSHDATWPNVVPEIRTARSALKLTQLWPLAPPRNSGCGTRLSSAQELLRPPHLCCSQASSRECGRSSHATHRGFLPLGQYRAAPPEEWRCPSPHHFACSFGTEATVDSGDCTLPRWI